MADAPGAATADANPDAPKKKAGREKLIVGGTLVLVILTYLILRRQSASSASSGVPAGVDPNTGIPYAQEYGGMGYSGGTTAGSPATAGYLNPQDPTILALEGQISGLQTQIAGLPTGAAQGGTTATSSGGWSATGTPVPGVGGHTAILVDANQPPPSLAGREVFNTTLGYDVSPNLTYVQALNLQKHPGRSPASFGYPT